MSWFILLVGLLLVLPSQGAGRYYEADRNTDEDLLNRIFEAFHRRQDKRVKEQESAPQPKTKTITGQYADDDNTEGFEVKVIPPSDNKEADFAVQNVDQKTEVNVADDTKQTDANTDKPASTEKNVTETPAPPVAHPQTAKKSKAKTVYDRGNMTFIFIVAACSVAGFIGLIMAGVCWYKLHSNVKAATDVDYPAYGVTGPTKDRVPSPGDRKLAQSAQMYHYQHQKQQMIAMEKASGELKPDASEEESEEENEEGDYTVYECPGLAPTGEMEVRNPLFSEDVQTPVNGQTPVVNGHPEQDGKP